ncbi:uncharacterized protein LOC130893364 [Diorhabda carinulata]|uniref:uncharacterized protein LOC130445419 n=1 Tax=Diorhabda sublineata TaxID=1163346 RepID=UPI0024E0AD52|nr:uncharacterized protein LOC130445419 [Diorhabda sublineata]XP_057655381.1 uncharacterized protein LOC130893364 [Diorhabda carinulata]
MVIITSLFITLILVNVGHGFVCPECNKSLCKEVSCGLGQELKPSPATCGCCDTCFTILYEGADCGQFAYILPSTSTTVCARGLTCYAGKCQNEQKVIQKLRESQTKTNN